MPPARPASGAAALREIAAEPLDVDFAFPAAARGQLGDAGADPVERRIAEVIPIERAQSWAAADPPSGRADLAAEPAIMAKWAVMFALVCMIAALTSGQA